MSLKSRRLEEYAYRLSYRTRWFDTALNGAGYFHLIDSVVNTYLKENCGIETSPLIGLVVSSYCQFFAPLAYPNAVRVGLSVVQIGKSSVKYEVGIFEGGNMAPSAVGGYTHVFVDSESRKSRPMDTQIRAGLDKLGKATSNKL